MWAMSYKLPSGLMEKRDGIQRFACRYRGKRACAAMAAADAGHTFQAVGWNAMFAPKGTPKDSVDKMNAVARDKWVPVIEKAGVTAD